MKLIAIQEEIKLSPNTLLVGNVHQNQFGFLSVQDLQVWATLPFDETEVTETLSQAELNHFENLFIEKFEQEQDEQNNQSYEPKYCHEMALGVF